ncbi:MAG: cupredoxin domain-containing protein [Candidatus Levybacteria bacterium]|nr:cupredoxin domain-containing protein [Candidatus Levybacteria bacterium]
MNSKILLAIVALIVIFGAFILLGNKKTSLTTSIEKSTPTQVQILKENVTVTLSDSGFTPKDITVKAGTRIIWVNKSGKAATVNSDDHPTHRLYPFLNLGEFADSSSVQVIVEKAGKYNYHNHYSASETGTITAQ